MQVIDEMRKENFSLKLKIFFMQDRLGKLAPEHIQAVLQEVLPHIHQVS
jgi:Centrosomin N-terminal motif 1